MYDITIYIFDTDQLNNLKSETLNSILKEIAPLYAQKYHKLSSAGNITGSLQELAAGLLLSRCLELHKDEALRFGQHGKPELVSGEAAFNLSHSGHFVVLAVADKAVGDVGVDIESAERVRLSVAKKLFSPTVYEEIVIENERDKKQAGGLFAKHWTACEARLKLSGAGFSGYDSIKRDYSESDKDVLHFELEDFGYVIALSVNANIDSCTVCKKIVQYY